MKDRKANGIVFRFNFSLHFGCEQERFWILLRLISSRILPKQKIQNNWTFFAHSEAQNYCSDWTELQIQVQRMDFKWPTIQVKLQHNQYLEECHYWLGSLSLNMKPKFMIQALIRYPFVIFETTSNWKMPILRTIICNRNEKQTKNGCKHKWPLLLFVTLYLKIHGMLDFVHMRSFIDAFLHMSAQLWFCPHAAVTSILKTITKNLIRNSSA